jgi:hypothetical protein
MVSKIFNRYIWLVNLLMQNGKLTFEEISMLWEDSHLGDGKSLPLRTFHQHRKAVEELFGIEIGCTSASDGYRYYIKNPQAIQNVPDDVEFVVGMAVSGKVTTKYSNNTSEVADAQYIFGGNPISKITGEKLKKSYASRNYLGYYCYYANDETAGSAFLFNEDFVKALGIEYAKDK